MEIGIMIAFVIGGIVAFSIYSTLFSNPRTAGSGFFEKYLKEQSVDPKKLPVALQDELVQISVQVTDMTFGTSENNRSNRLQWNTEFQNQLKIQAILISAYIRNSNETFLDMMSNMGESSDSFIELYRKHGL